MFPHCCCYCFPGCRVFISPVVLTRLLRRSIVILPRSVCLASCWSASTVSGVASAGPRCGSRPSSCSSAPEGRGRAEGGGASVTLAFSGGKRECSRIGVAICAGAGVVCASQTLRTRSGPMLACRLRHLSHPRDSRDWSKYQPPNTLYPRPSNACILGYGCKVLLLPLLRGDDTLTLSPCWPVSRTQVSN